MFRIRSVVRPLAITIACAFTLVPMTAFADNTTAPAKKAERHQRPKLNFPVDAQLFRKVVEKKIEHARENIDKQLKAHKVPAAQQAEIKKHFEAAVKQIRTAADQVASDGTVTKEEAQKVRELAKDLKKQAREQAHTKKS